ncbi:hypothetical protein BB559_002596 [Furculomyces boomerangus]|uniref:Holocytochrome c-type synthase n=2 Tax=Harpellales TaxID=61421 RepID=A0A2T9YU56_9FUNG|nr:hypothetical protein BB559_002596 [Furculomyces boomerangus]PWA01959.1 hypothetical protein BB558_001916 [Smittium angustum]
MSSSTPKCPVDHDQTPQKCPVSSENNEVINPLNMMPELTQDKHHTQTKELSIDREISTIPRTKKVDSSNNTMLNTTDADSEYWEYPSNQQFYNALARKGMGVPEEEVDMMVQIHNFLNEGAWNEVLNWEKMHDKTCKIHRLIKLQGRPNDLSPKARVLGWFGGARPFDRHDWYVDRCGRQVRYVIDYYEAPPVDGSPVFSLDVRPAMDSFDSLVSRFKMMFK